MMLTLIIILAKIHFVHYLGVGTQVASAMYPGMIISYKVSQFLKLSLNWITEITHVNKPYYFVDEQRFGPYQFWHHQHFFEEVADGIITRDIVDYALAFDPLSRIISNIIAKRLDSIFQYRYQTLDKMFNGKRS